MSNYFECETYQYKCNKSVRLQTWLVVEDYIIIVNQTIQIIAI